MIDEWLMNDSDYWRWMNQIIHEIYWRLFIRFIEDEWIRLLKMNDEDDWWKLSIKFTDDYSQDLLKMNDSYCWRWMMILKIIHKIYWRLFIRFIEDEWFIRFIEDYS
jgi:hypothetical protein